jgi:hypothetical protein
LHPHCQTLNHAGETILNDPDLNFIGDYSDEKFSRFNHFAIATSQGGKRGSVGGSITLSHAFAEHRIMRKTYRERYGSCVLKETIKCIVWKDSLRVQNFIKEHEINLARLLGQNRKLRFLMPIRNPMDCAISNWKRSGKHFSLESRKLEDVLHAVLRELLWVIDCKKEFPDRVFFFFQHEFDKQMLINLAHFLQLEPEDRWMRDSIKCYQLTDPYSYEEALVKHYTKWVQEYLKSSPSLLEQFLSFVPDRKTV